MWTLVLISTAVAIVIIVAAVRSKFAAQKRSAKWGDLRERGKMFASQLAHLQEISTPVEPLAAPETKLRGLQPSGKIRSFWPLRPTAQRTIAPDPAIPSSKVV